MKGSEQLFTGKWSCHMVQDYFQSCDNYDRNRSDLLSPLISSPKGVFFYFIPTEAGS